MRKPFLLFILMLCMATAIEAVPAYRGAIRAKQPDGTTVTIFLRGDEHSHEVISTDGYRLMQDNNGAYRYVQLAADQRLTVEGSPVAHDPVLRNAEERAFVSTLKLSAELPKASVRAFDAAPATGIRRSGMKKAEGSASRFQLGTFPTKGQAKCVVLLVQFTDVKFSLDRDYHDRMMNETDFSENGATGSAKDYYFAQSMGLFEPHFDVIGPITLSHNVSYYGADDMFGSTDTNAGVMIREACNKASTDFGTDFSQYDGDGDGMVDMVYVIYAGYGQHAGGGSNTIWPHKYQLSGYGLSLTLNGKAIDTYACSSELFGNSGTQSSGIGTVCHEFGHVLGLADHYNTTNSTDYKLGRYDIMDYGGYNNDGNTPAGYNAFERMTLGWLTPTELSEPADGLTLYNMAEHNEAYLIKTSSEDEFYLLENRRKTRWDSYIPGEGLMITHVDYDQSAWTSNNLNDTEDRPRFYIVAADNELGYDIVLNKTTEEYDLYPSVIPGRGTNDSFTDNSVPAAQPRTGETLDKWVTSIARNNDGTVSFDFMANHLQAPVGLWATVPDDNTIAASWEETPKATRYTVNLHKLAYRSAQKEAINEDFSLMAAGSVDSPSSTDISGSLDAYTAVKGWTGSRVYQAGGWCMIGSSTAAGTLTTPSLNMKRFDGEFTVAVTVRSVTGKQPVFSVTANGLSGRTRITSTARTYLFRFSGGISKTPITFATNNERALIDDIMIVRGDAADMFPDAREVTVEGTPDVTEGEVEDMDFIHVDTLSVENITEPSYTFTSLEPKTYYAFTVKAQADGAESALSEEYVVYTDHTTGIENVTAPTTNNGKREIYTIDGRRVNSMNAKGIYIVKQGNKTVKVIKNR